MANAIQISGFKTFLCAAAMMAALPAMSGAGDKPSLSLSDQSLSVAVAAKEELMRQVPHVAHQDCSMRIYDNVTYYDAYLTFGGSLRCSIGVPDVCGSGCGRCLHIVIGTDLKVVGSAWYNSIKIENDVSESVLNGMVLPF